MTIGALVSVGLERAWLEALPRTLGLDGVRVRIQDVLRGEIACTKVDFDIPPQPHGRHIAAIREIVERSGAPADVRRHADAAFVAIATAEAEIHGTTPDRVHLHEVGAVDAILDVVGSVWGFALLEVSAVYCGPLQVGDGFVRAAHGLLPVPAPATLKLLEGHAVRPGPEGAGELVTPTGAAIVRVLSQGGPPATFVPRRSGFGAGTRDPAGRANALRITLADELSGAVNVEYLGVLAADVDDMSGEYLAAAAESLRCAGALDVTLTPILMKKGRPGIRLELLCTERDLPAMRTEIFSRTSTIGVRESRVMRSALVRTAGEVQIEGQNIRLKIVRLPDGSSRAKPEYDDVLRAAEAIGRSAVDVHDQAVGLARERAP